MKRLFIMMIFLLAIAGCTVQEPTGNLTTEEFDLPQGVEEGELLNITPPEPVPQPTPGPTETEDVQQQPDVQPTTPLAFKLDLPKLTVDCYGSPCMSYLGAYAMAARHYNKGIDLYSVAGYGNIGSAAVYHSNQDIDNGIAEDMMIKASKNYGYVYDLGLGLHGIDSPSTLSFEDNAENVMYFNHKDHALDSLKKAVSAGYPVIVYLDASYLQEELSKQTVFWRSFPDRPKGYYLAITAYDNDFIYFHGPNDEHSKNVYVTVNSFILAWEATKFLPEDKLGPFWMFVLKRGDQKKADAEELIITNLEEADDAIDELEKFGENSIKTDEVCEKILVLAKTRDMYSQFLRRHEFNLASAMYRDSGDFLRYACDDGIRQNFEKAAVKEGNAHNAIR